MQNQNTANILNAPYLAANKWQVRLREIVRAMKVWFTGKFLGLLGRSLASSFSDIDIDVLASLSPSSTVIAGALSISLYKEHGHNQDIVLVLTDENGVTSIEGSLQAGKRGVLILDIIYTAQPVLRAVEVFEQRGCKAVAVAGVLNLLSEKDRNKLCEKDLVVRTVYDNEDELLLAVLNESKNAYPS